MNKTHEHIINKNVVYADWCGPCKAIAPTFESLSTKYAKPGKITFAKVNVDNQQSIASAHQVTAMPTFVIFKGTSELQRVRGADPRSLTDAVEKAVKLASTAAPGASFQSPGRTLGAGGGGGSAAPAGRGATSGGGGGQTLGGRKRSSFSLFNFFNAVLTFFGLYVASLFSVCVPPPPPPPPPKTLLYSTLHWLWWLRCGVLCGLAIRK